MIAAKPSHQNPLNPGFCYRVEETTLKFRKSNGRARLISDEHFLSYLREVEKNEGTVELFRDTQPQFRSPQPSENSDDSGCAVA